MSRNDSRVAIIMPTFDVGGVERMLINLATGIVQRGVPIDLVVSEKKPAYLDDHPNEFRIVSLGGGRRARLREQLTRYLVTERPAAALASKLDASLLLLEARRAAGIPLRTVIRAATNVSGSLSRSNPVKRWLTYRAVRAICRQADAVVAVSQGVANDLSVITALSPRRIEVIANPVITPRMFENAAQPVAHPWFATNHEPVVVSVGRFSRAKDFPTLIRAFARLRTQYRCRLVILGEGRQRSRIRAAIAKSGLQPHVDLPGFVANPYAYVAKANLFVLSSLWEGSPNTITEALALGCPVVSTDCPSGPSEILQQGRYGRLVPVGDESGLAAAMLDTLRNPPNSAFLSQAVGDYSMEASAARYLEVLGMRR